MSDGCPLCKAPPHKVIYMGLPMLFCAESDCQCLWGLWSFIPVHFPAEGDGWTFMFYEGSYWKALWRWLKG